MTGAAEPTYAALTTVSRETVGPGGSFRHRTVGVFRTAGDAVEVLAGDYGDLNEAGYYTHAVLETLPFGLYPTCRRVRDDSEEQWFEYRHPSPDGAGRRAARPVACQDAARGDEGRLLPAQGQDAGAAARRGRRTAAAVRAGDPRAGGAMTDAEAEILRVARWDIYRGSSDVQHFVADLLSAVTRRVVTHGAVVELVLGPRPPRLALVSVREAAEIIGCHKSNLRRTPGCPEPFADLACGPVWLRRDIEQWATSREHRRAARQK